MRPRNFFLACVPCFAGGGRASVNPGPHLPRYESRNTLSTTTSGSDASDATSVRSSTEPSPASGQTSMTASIDRVDPPSVVNHGGLEKVLTDDQVSLIVPSPLDRLYLIAMCYGTQSFACGHGALTLGERSCSLYNVTSVVIPEQSQDQIEAQTFTEDFLLDPTYRPNLPLLGHHRNEDPIVLSYGLPNLVVTPTLNQTLNAPIARRDIA